MRLLALTIMMFCFHILTAGNAKRTERINAVFQGIVDADGQTENAVKHRINTGDKANDAKDQTVASIFDNKFCIPLDLKSLNPAFLSISMV